MQETPATNSTAHTVDVIVNDTVIAAEAVAEAAAESALDTALPFFALPVVKQVTDEIIHLIISKLGREFSLGLQQIGTFIVIDLQVSGEKKGLSKALQDLILAEKSGNKEAINAAIQAYQKAQSALVNSDGSAPPV